MRIEKVECVLLSERLEDDHIVRWSGGEMTTANVAPIVVVHTDVGLTGIGDTYSGGLFYPTAIKALIEHFETVLIGRDPRNPVRLATDLRSKSLYWGRVGAAINAISAIENALWDIAGQEAGLPVWKMVGGLAHERLMLYASAGLNKAPDAVVKEMEGHLARGFRAVKIRVPADVDEAVAKVKLCREVLGPSTMLMVDAVMGSHPSPWDAKAAIRFAHLIEEYDIAWLEEPCGADDHEGYALTRKNTSIPISGGETSYGISEFMHFFAAGSLDVVQPDACTSGGIVECQRIAAVAAAHGVKVAPHAWGSSATIAARILVGLSRSPTS